MARTITAMAYTFDELSEEAKENARNWWRESIDDWWTDIYHDIQTLGEIIGISFDTRTVRLMNGESRRVPAFTFDLDRNRHFGFSGTYSYQRGWKEKAKAEYGKDVFVPEKASHRLATFLREWDSLQASIQKPAFYGLTCDFDAKGGGIHVTGYHYIPAQDYTNTTNADQDSDLEELLELFQSQAIDMLESEWNWINADDYIDENIRGNDYEFDEEGGII